MGKAKQTTGSGEWKVEMEGHKEKKGERGGTMTCRRPWCLA